MPIIADHCQPGGWRHNAEPYTPAHPWPDDAYVQWGSNGIVFGSANTYRTAFFEAFPRNPDTFIRGEGTTIAEAEAVAYAKYRRQAACPGHEFERRGYTNGAGVCEHCGLFASQVFKPLTRCSVCDTPTTYAMGYGRDVPAEVGKMFWYCEEHQGERLHRGHWSPIDALYADDEYVDLPGAPKVARPVRPEWMGRLAGKAPEPNAAG